jgi:protein gp37
MTGMEWTDETWNPVTGCSRVSEGCEYCSARRAAQRLRGRFGYPEDDPFKVTPRPDLLTRPLHWKKPRRVRVCSMGDIAHHDVPKDFFLRMWMVMRRCPQHTFMLLTKRTIGLSMLIRWAEAEANMSRGHEESEMPSHIWVGVSAENQKCFDDRIAALVQIPVATKFVVVEPMLGPVSVTRRACAGCGKDICDCPLESGLTFRDNRPGMQGPYWPINQVICGAGAGPKAGPEMSRWVADLKNQCADADIPFFLRESSSE